MSVSPEEVRSVAELARLRLTEEEVERFTRELNSILEHVDALTRAPVPEGPGEDEELPPPGGDRAPFRSASVPGPDPLREGPESIAPRWREGFFVVPRLPAVEGPDLEPEEG